MQNTRIGVVLIILALIAGGFFYSTASDLEQRSRQQECNPSQQCQDVATSLGYTHMAMGALGAILSLGIYLVVFNKSEEAILERLEAEKERELAQERLAIMLQALDENEKKILEAVADEQGITQRSLRHRTGLSKAKISQVLSSFEKRDLIEREAKGRTYAVFLKQAM
jgi:uncharacterized membrane protein